MSELVKLAGLWGGGSAALLLAVKAADIVELHQSKRSY